MSNEIVNRKVLGLDALQYIKEYIDRVNANTNNRIDIELKDYIGDRITTAANAINSDYTAKYNELIDRIAQAESEGNAEKIHQLELELSRLQGDTANKFSALEGLAADLARLSGEYDSLYEGITTGSVFTAGQLDEIINTAVIKSTKITDDMVETPNLYTSNIVALIAKFGQINAANIVGGSIKGHTIESNNIVTGSGEPVWAIKDEGEGWLAKGNISWDREGNVTFGDQARISFNNVDGAESKLNELMHGYDDQLQGYVRDYITAGITGTSIFTSIVFTRADHRPMTPEGGDYYNPIPTGTDADGNVIEWTDHIPVGDKILWSSTRVFASTAYDDKQQPYWSDPVQMTDTSTFDVDFSSVAENPGDPTTNPENWTNTGDETSIWMATRTIENGVESEWQVMKIKGEKGQDGKSINVKGSYDTLDEFKTAIAGDELNNPPADTNDCYVVDRDLWVWDSTQWINVGRFAGHDAISKFKSTVFKRSNDDLTERPTGGTWENPTPDDTTWTDGIPEGIGKIWQSTRTFYSDEETNALYEWSVPALMVDTESFEVAYGSAEVTNYNPLSTGLPKDANGKANPSGVFEYGWVDEPVDDVEYHYMATAKCNNGEWSNWTVSKIKGEDGKDGTSITITGEFPSEEALIAALPEGPADASAAYIVNGYMYVWVMGSWKNVGQFLGKDGVSVVGTTTRYGLSDNDVDKPTAWSEDVPTLTQGKYLWTETTWTYSDDREPNVTYQKTYVAKDGNDGNDGMPGADGVSIVRTEILYGLSQNENELPDAWGESSPALIKGWYLWTKTTWYYSEGEPECGYQKTYIGEDGVDGINGDSAYLYMKYAKDIEFDDNKNIINIVLTADEGASVEEAKWLGIGHGNVAEEPYPIPGDDVYSWTKIYVDPIIVPTKFKSTVFTRQTIDISGMTPVGGTWDNPKPNDAVYNGVGVAWEDGIPAGNEGTIWSTTRMFSSDEDFTNTTIQWDAPTKMMDAPEFETAYGLPEVANADGSASEAGLPKDASGKANPDGTFNYGWTDEPEDGVEYHYMATATKKDGEWSNWTVFRIKGEKGDRGAGVKYKNTYITIDRLDVVTPPESEEDAYIIKTNPEDVNDNQWNHLFVWTGLHMDDNIYNSEDGFYKGWADTGKFNGSDGKDGKDGKDGADGITTYVYIKYANNIEYNEDGTLNYANCECSANGGEQQGRWMGLGNGSDPNDPIIDKNIDGYTDANWDKYKWTELVDQSRIDTAVVTEFGKYDIKANLIKGKTIQTTSNTALINGTKVETFDEDGISTGVNEQSQGPAWQLRNRGDGYLAKGNISWDENGEVTLSNNVKLKWNQIDDASDAVSTAINASNATLKTELETNIETAKNELNTAITTNEQAVQALTNSINSTKSELESKYDNQIATINNDIVNANNALAQAQSELLTAIQNGDAAAIQNANDKVNALQETVDGLSETADNLTSKYNEQKNALDTLKNIVEDLQISNGAGLTENQVNELISTAFIDGTYIQSDSIESPNVFTTNLMALVAKFGTVKASNVTSGILQGSTVQSNVSINGNYSGDVVEDPTWRITNDGAGYLAKGNIEWTDAGDLTVKSVNGAVTIGDGVGVGPWKTFTENNVDFIGDGESFDSSKNVFGQDGTFKVGGNAGFVKSSSTGAINVGSDVVFGDLGNDDNDNAVKVWKLQSKDVNLQYDTDYVYIGRHNVIAYSPSTGDRNELVYDHIWVNENAYKKVVISDNIIPADADIIITSDGPELLKNQKENDREYEAYFGDVYYNFEIGGDAIFIHQYSYSSALGYITNIRYENLYKDLTDEDLTDWWDKTEISGNKIKTGTIDASKVTVTNLNANNITAGKIAADKIDVDDLTVKNLNTSGEGIIDKGTINIQNNDLTVYSNTTAGKPVLKITGNSLDTLPQKPTEFSVGKYLSGSFNEYFFEIDMKPSGGWQIYDMRVLPYHDLFIGEFEVPDDATYSLSKITDWAFTLQFNVRRSKQSSAGPSIYAYAQTYIIDENSNIPDQPFDEVIEGPLYEEEHRIDLYRDYDGSLNQTYSLYGGDLYLNERPILSGNSYTISSGKYKIYCRFAIDNSGANQQYDDIRISSVKYSHTNVAKITPSSTDTDMSRVDISSYGFRYIINDTKYVTMTKNGSFILRNGNNILAVDDEGIAMAFNGSLDNVKRIVPQEFVFRTDMNDGSSSNGSRWNRMTVLCLGSPVKVDNGD